MKPLWLLFLASAALLIGTGNQIWLVVALFSGMAAMAATVWRLLMAMFRFQSGQNAYRPQGGGLAQRKCRRCDGSGSVRCPGSGIPGGVSDCRRCPNCRGTNRVPCPSCAGKGFVIV
jgi:hypothetical protein